MIDGSEKRKRQLASVLQNSRVFEKRCNQNIDSNLGLLFLLMLPHRMSLIN